MSSSSFRLSVIALSLLSFSLVAPLASAAVCPSTVTTGNINDGSYSTLFSFSENQVKLTDITLNQPQTIISLALQLAGGGDVVRDFQVVLGLYKEATPDNFQLLTVTSPITVPATMALLPQVISAPVLTSYTAQPGKYYLARLVDVSGLILYGNGNFNEPGRDFTFNGSLPYQVLTDYNSTEVRSAIVGCPVIAGPLADPPAAVTGDPVFVGFHGQVYQVHGIAGEMFTLITTRQVQLNAQFVFIDRGEALTAGQQAEQQIHSMHHAPLLPPTAAWSHPGTYIGSIGLQVAGHSLVVTPGHYGEGFSSLHFDGRHVHPSPSGKWLRRGGGVDIRLMGWSRLVVRTPEVALHIVNSDGFFNLENVELLSAGQGMEGILGQSADGTRYFPLYNPTVNATHDVKSDFQKHQIHDYLILDHDLMSTDFEANVFVKPKPPSSEDESVTLNVSDGRLSGGSEA